MINIQNIDGYGMQDPGFELLRQVAQKYCPEELQQVRQEVIPDEVINFAAIEGLLTPPLTPPLQGRGVPTDDTQLQRNLAPTNYAQPLPAPQGEGSGVGSVIPQDNGFGIGIPETQKLLFSALGHSSALSPAGHHQCA